MLVKGGKWYRQEVNFFFFFWLPCGLFSFFFSLFFSFFVYQSTKAKPQGINSVHARIHHHCMQRRSPSSIREPTLTTLSPCRQRRHRHRGVRGRDPQRPARRCDGYRASSGNAAYHIRPGRPRARTRSTTCSWRR